MIKGRYIKARRLDFKARRNIYLSRLACVYFNPSTWMQFLKENERKEGTRKETVTGGLSGVDKRYCKRRYPRKC